MKKFSKFEIIAGITVTLTIAGAITSFWFPVCGLLCMFSAPVGIAILGLMD